jgi:hypothetical protein
MYFTLVAAFIFYGWLQPKTYSRMLLLAATATTIFAVPVSISRSLLLGMLIVAAFGLAVTLKDPRRIPRFLGPVVAAAGFLAFAGNSIYVEVFSSRWDMAAGNSTNSMYGSTVGRALGEYLEPFKIAATTPLLGYGVGLGTVGGARLTTGEYTFLLAESELARCVLELGPILGFAFIAWRLWLAVKLVSESWRNFLNVNDPLAWLIAGATFIGVINGQWGPATQLGFSVFGAGLTLAALNEPAAEAAGLEVSDQMSED